MKKVIIGILAVLSFTANAQNRKVSEWVSSTETKPWQEKKLNGVKKDQKAVEIYTNKSLQKIEGFGSCFNELGWTSLNQLNVKDRENIFKELYSKNGANFTISRMPVGANDFSRDWYSYDETDGDFAMNNFSIKNDFETLIPFIKSAQKYNPNIKLWASPWSPPTWMKYNKHYALNKVPSVMQQVNNGIQDNQLVKEGTDNFIQEDQYFKAYSLYFKKFIEAYQKENIKISMVMPQNEFNSAQWYPSNTWTPAGLTKFISYLGPDMQSLGVDVFFGTLERGNPTLFSDVYKNTEVKKYIKGIGVQWAGKEAVSTIHKEYPNLTIYQSEHECGNGKNDWAYAEYSWDLMKHYFLNGTSAYLYWNTSLLQGGVSRWGWTQNSLVTVDAQNKTYHWNPEFYVMKHFSHYVQPGAVLLQTSSQSVDKHRNDVLGWWEGNLSSNADNVLAFKNPDNSIVVIAYNDQETPKELHLKVDQLEVNPTLEAKSFNTLLIK
ncbi:glycoside hydrolase family 30 protein [Flavobacterium sp. MC2016-06]|uniref:glycoside hydrolase family 30 protein n=1 Tax=Flavobacterium sp. MC2016-06 TaxID=2676308 RepID=UPI0012BAD633|nr:glycoside hydrolase family 30 protein [Flavobacterium sp. MC2016-06]MBU3858776.1 hypothetical protein [Flavobacterium sp. MC2016-06]